MAYMMYDQLGWETGIETEDRDEALEYLETLGWRAFDTEAGEFVD